MFRKAIVKMKMCNGVGVMRTPIDREGWEVACPDLVLRIAFGLYMRHHRDCLDRLARFLRASFCF